MTRGSEQSWIAALQEGDEDAAQQLFEEYFLRLVGLARKKLQALPASRADASGAALSAINSFLQGAKRRVFPRLNDRDDLWRLLVVITARKASHVVRDEKRLKRGGGKVRGESALRMIDSDFDGLQQIVGAEPTPEMAAILAEEFERRLADLGDESLETVVRLKLEGYTNAEIAEQLNCVERTVERKLGVIRKIWEEKS